MFGYEALDGVPAEAGVSCAGEQRVVGSPRVFWKPVPEDANGGGRDQDPTLFAAFAAQSRSLSTSAGTC
jgi:hypothetical protein